MDNLLKAVLATIVTSVIGVLCQRGVNHVIDSFDHHNEYNVNSANRYYMKIKKPVKSGFKKDGTPNPIFSHTPKQAAAINEGKVGRPPKKQEFSS